MINISGYITDIDEDIVDNKNFLSVNSCGYYKLVKLASFETSRPDGRSDYQLLYVAKGSADFLICEDFIKVEEGYAVIYHPHQPQYYIYHLQNNPEIYWLHFSGAQAQAYITNLNFTDGFLFNVGIKNEYKSIFEKIISELQVRRKNFFELSNLYAMELLSLMSRNMSERSSNLYLINEQILKIIETMNKNFSQKQSIMDYAKTCSMSTCWFINNFKNYTGMTPQQYLTNIRLTKAKELLLSSSFNISEISSIVGYDNPFYFSRIFKKNTGYSPREYKYIKANNSNQPTSLI